MGPENSNFYKSVAKFFVPNKNTPIIILGDFNFVENPETDRSKASIAYQNETEISRRIFGDISSARNLVDIYKHLHPNGVGFTHFNKGCGIHSH